MNAPRLRQLPRRTLLKGLGGIAIGMPFLEEMAAAASASHHADVPTRAINVFFGLGVPAPLQQEGYDGVLEPLKPLAHKLLIMREVDHVRADEPGINAHFDGATAAFTAEPPDGTAKAGGASIDQVLRRHLHPDGLPPNIVPTLAAGTFFRRCRVGRYLHTFNPDGTAAATMQEKPRDLFERVFGKIEELAVDPDSRRDRLKRSVLDSVVDQYRLYTGPRSPLGHASKGRIADHLDRIREYEQRAFALRSKSESLPAPPPRSKLLHGDDADPGGEGIDITLEELSYEWRLMADLYALALLTDRARFGAITFLAAGERIRLKGEYELDGRHIYSFDDAALRRGKSGAAACSHEYWHEFNPQAENAALRAHAHMKMREVAYFLQALDAPDAREANGKTVLDNSLITISTESGDGRHSDVKRELSGIFHAVTSAGGRLKTGQIVDAKAEGLDVYNTILDSFGAPRQLGPQDREHRPVDSIRA